MPEVRQSSFALLGDLTKVSILLLSSGSAWIRIILGSWIRISIRAKSWIRVLIQVNIQELYRLKMEPWRAVDAHNRGGRGWKWSPGGSAYQYSHIRITVDPDLHRSENPDPH
jgi:hypothetical protein